MSLRNDNKGRRNNWLAARIASWGIPVGSITDPKGWLILLMWLVVTARVSAQQFPLLEVEDDSMEVEYFFPDAPEQIYREIDTSLYEFQQFDPTRQQGNLFWGHLGMLGTAARPLYFRPLYRLGLQPGMTAYQSYRLLPDSIRFYRLNKAYTKTWFSQGGTQGDTYFKGTFSRNFGENLNLMVDYRRLNQVGSGSAYKFQDLFAQHTALVTGLWYRSNNRKYNAWLTYQFDINKMQHNGGIQTDTLFFEEGFEGAFVVPINLDQASGRFDHQHLTFQHRLNFSRSATDTTQAGGLQGYAHHKVQYSLFRYLYQDAFTNPPSASDSLVYQRSLTDPRGLRQFTRVRALTNHFRLGLRLNDKQQLEAGLWHRLFAITQEPFTSNRQNLFLTARTRLQVADWGLLEGSGHLGLLDDQAGDFRIQGKLSLELAQLGRLQVQLIAQANAPTLTEDRFIVTEREVWNRDFDKSFSTSLQGQLYINPLDIYLEGGYHLLNNYLYFGPAAEPRQEGEALNVLQLSVKKELVIWRFHFYNRIGLQEIAGPDVLRLPRLISSHSLFFEGDLFRRNLRMRIGGDLRYHSGYFADAFHPVSQQFILQNEAEVPQFMALDLFASFKVKTFRFFIKMDNASNELFIEEPKSMTYRYPLQSGIIRFGIGWNFRD